MSKHHTKRESFAIGSIRVRPGSSSGLDHLPVTTTSGRITSCSAKRIIARGSDSRTDVSST